MEWEDTVLGEDFNPAFLFTWKGIQRKDAENYHKHDHLELCYVMSGRGRHRLGGKIHEVGEGDLILINAGSTPSLSWGKGRGPLWCFMWGSPISTWKGRGQTACQYPGRALCCTHPGN